MFSRTPLGLANEHLFYRVDYMVYCEGESAAQDVLSLDEAFWTKVFGVGAKSVRVKSVGSKTNAQPFVSGICSGVLKNTIVAMDSDYTHCVGCAIDHPQIFYTRGYSWESDVIHQLDFERVLSLFCNVRDVSAAKTRFERFVERNQRIFWRACLIDMRYISAPRALFNRGKPASIIGSDDDGFPRLGCDRLVAGARSLRGTSTAPVSLPFDGPDNGLLYFYGKSAAKLIYQWFVAYSSRIRGKRSVPFDAFMSILIELMDVRAGRSTRDVYYRRVLGRI